MLKLKTLAAFTFSALASATAAQSAIQSEFIPVAEGEQALRQTLVVDLPLSEAWARFTSEAGVKSWMAPVAQVELRSGGTIRTNYDGCAAIGDEGTITLEIVNFVPERFILLRSDLSVADDASWMNDSIRARADQLSNLIEFEPDGEGRTRITSWGLGYGTGDDWEQITSFFIAGNEWSYGQLFKAIDGEEIYPACTES